MERNIIYTAAGSSLALTPQDLAYLRPEAKALPAQIPLANGLPLSLEKITLDQNNGFVHATANISPTAKIHPRAIIGQGVVIGAGVEIGPDCVIGDYSVIAPNSKLRGKTLIGMHNRLTGPAKIIHDVCIISGNTITATVLGRGVFIGVDNNIHGSILAAQVGVLLGNKLTQCQVAAAAQILSKNIVRQSRVGAKALLEHENNISGAQIDGAARLKAKITVKPESVIGANAWIDNGVTLARKTFLAPKVKIGAYTELASDVIVGRGAELGEYCKVAKEAVIPPKTKIAMGKYVKFPFEIHALPGLASARQKLDKLLGHGK